MTIGIMLIAGGLAGLMIGRLAVSEKAGCALLFVIPLSTIVFVAISQALRAEILRSTSALEYFFYPLWPSIGAILGFGLGLAMRPHRNDR